MYDYLIVGAGLFGSIFAYEAKKRGKNCLVIDKRPHIGGNIYTKEVEGINVHEYGAHIFHTSNHEVWKYIQQFATFNRYTNSPIARYRMCAAVADFTPETVAGHKIKREKDNLTLQLKPTQDIAAALGNRKKDGQTLVGFALETNDETKNAQRKLERKNLDFIVLNSLNDQGAGFRCDTNKITIIDRQGATPYPLKSKQEVARDIIDRLVNNK